MSWLSLLAGKCVYYRAYSMVGIIIHFMCEKSQTIDTRFYECIDGYDAQLVPPAPMGI